MKTAVAKQSRWRLTAGQMARAVHGELTGDPGIEIGPVSIDTRTLEAGDLFFAIRGDRFDGHAFVAGALDAGALGIVVSDTTKVPAVPQPRVTIVVRDTVEALQDLARFVRRESGARVVAITGSTGKTSTKEIVADFLSTRYRVVRNRGNLNNHIGLPLSLMELRHRPQIAVMELGMNRLGEIALLVAIAEPDVRVWTNVGQAHLGFFESADAVADAKAEIMQGADADSVLVANADDEQVMARARRFPGRLVTFGMRAAAEVAATDVRDRGVDGTEAMLRIAEGQATVNVPLLGQGQLANVLAAVAVALEFHIPLRTIVERTSGLRPPPHRGEVVRLRDGITLIDDSYNSSPSALHAALEVFQVERPQGRRIAVLGEMLELGAHALELHRRSGVFAATCGLDALVTVGGEAARALAGAAVASGLDPAVVRHAATSEQAAVDVTAMLAPGDLLLVKGSRGIRTDLVVEHLTKELA